MTATTEEPFYGTRLPDEALRLVQIGLLLGDDSTTINETLKRAGFPRLTRVTVSRLKQRYSLNAVIKRHSEEDLRLLALAASELDRRAGESINELVEARLKSNEFVREFQALTVPVAFA